MAVKIAVTREYEDEEDTFTQTGYFCFCCKKVNCFKWYIFNFWRLCTWLVSKNNHKVLYLLDFTVDMITNTITQIG